MSTIALVMIARDEARCIARCLRSAAPFVDAMWVLDTGSADDTAAIAAACGASVRPWAWCDDFAAARNAALALHGCDWALVLDADEWIEGGAEALHRKAPDHLGLVRVASRVGDDAQPERSVSWLPRLLPRGVGYAGRVHEQPVSTLPRRHTTLEVGHDGYLPQHAARKAGRNRRLLEAALHEQGEDAYLRYQLGKDLEVHGDFAAAAPHYAQALTHAEPAAAWRHDLVLRQLFTLKKLARFDEALALASAEAARWTHSPDFHFALGDLLLDLALARPAHAAAVLPQVEAAWRRALVIGENPALPDTVRGRGSFLAAHNLAALYGGLGDEAAALHWRERAAAMRAAA